MQYSAAPLTKTSSTVTYLNFKDRSIPAQAADLSPVRSPWTDELERRRKAVARWRGNDAGLKETMMRE